MNRRSKVPIYAVYGSGGFFLGLTMREGPLPPGCFLRLWGYERTRRCARREIKRANNRKLPWVA